jgi:dTDP-4-dehydrorhamnose 3,5-epimerase
MRNRKWMAAGAILVVLVQSRINTTDDRNSRHLQPDPSSTGHRLKMDFQPANLRDVFLVQLEPANDGRGFFARTFCVEEFATHGLETDFPQHSISFSARKGTLRGMHHQSGPGSEVKLVRCIRGTILDVIIDIRPSSPTYRHWQAFELSSSNRHQLYIPKGFAHGFQTLSDDVEVSYLISTPYQPGLAGGIRYNDPTFGIAWPLPVTEISEKDLRWPDFSQ